MATSNRNSINLGLPTQPEMEDPKMFNELFRLYSACNQLASGIDALTGSGYIDPATYSAITPGSTLLSNNQNRLIIAAGETIGPGQPVYFYRNGGVLTAKLAQQAFSQCEALADIASPVAAGALFPVVLFGLVTRYSGATIGAAYYLDDTVPGRLITTNGVANQYVGKAITANAIFLRPNLT